MHVRNQILNYCSLLLVYLELHLTPDRYISLSAYNFSVTLQIPMNVTSNKVHDIGYWMCKFEVN